MSATDTNSVLEQAYGLIEANKLSEAKALLKPVLETEKDNADVWWVYAHAVDDPETARIALNNVLRLDPSYPEAKELLVGLDKQNLQGVDIEDFDKEPSFLSAKPPTTLPGLTKPAIKSLSDSDDDFPDDFDDDDLDDGDDEEPAGLSRRGLILVSSIVGLLLIVALVIVIARPFATTSDVSPTVAMATSTLEIAVNPTTSPDLSATVPSQAVDETPLATFESQAGVLGDDLTNTITSALSSLNVTKEDVEITQTDLGSTLVVKICAQAGLDMRQKLTAAMNTLAQESNSYANQVAAVGVRMQDCDANTPLLMLGAKIEDALAVASGSLSEEDFQAKWSPIS